jgi:ATP dependent DNA ligase domain
MRSTSLPSTAKDIRPHPWEIRRATLAGLLRKAGTGIRLSEHLDATDGASVFQHACRMGLEGIVAKRLDRPYRSGRSPDWVKIKNPDAPAASRVIESCDGAMTFGDLIGRLDHLEIACPKCDRLGRYSDDAPVWARLQDHRLVRPHLGRLFSRIWCNWPVAARRRRTRPAMTKKPKTPQPAPAPRCIAGRYVVFAAPLPSRSAP